MSWQEFVTRYRVGDVVDGVVTKQVPFGSFVETDGHTGLAYQQVWPVDARVSVRIVAIDTDRERFSVEAA
ncbi:S1 RNA-binding domain-containing protein [Dactylosporangium vinaceum]|uniref:S1 RNA-binding domain-containing protein n=1 Tax=Dactylosporangium vinaceum TaxID=53362 RepID=A0ABV5M9B1_9ACTN|nr:S1 RNA-binding domain-containing protein [Dactylosporangium vinaceum]UAB99950.1 S1 RNA-binding domain-containing protein [Dactylosporangium vinaceum]